MATFSLTKEEYEALISLARKGATTVEKMRALDAFLRSIERANQITRYALWIQWQELDQPLPPSTNFPTVWPPELRFYMENLTRPVAKVDVTKIVASKARNPTNILVTPDPAAKVGWTPVDTYFVT